MKEHICVARETIILSMRRKWRTANIEPSYPLLVLLSERLAIMDSKEKLKKQR